MQSHPERKLMTGVDENVKNPKRCGTIAVAFCIHLFFTVQLQKQIR